MDAQTVSDNIRDLAVAFAGQRGERQRRRALDPADFDRIRAAGFHLASLPVSAGGLWEGPARSARLLAELLRTLAQGDSSVALVCAMHPAVLFGAGWPQRPAAATPFAEAWRAQRDWVFQTVRAGAWWGTITSEPGSGGDMSKTKAVARPAAAAADGLRYRLSGQKHFGSGAGICSYMITTALPEGEAEPDVFLLDLRGAPWEGAAGAATGVTLVAPWDGHGMPATQSHALAFTDFPATRLAWPMPSQRRVPERAGGGGPLFSAVFVGIVEAAMAEARRQLAGRRAALRPYEQVEWARAEVEAWLIQQAYAGMVGAVEREAADAGRGGLLGKTAVAELAEAVLGRLCRVLGGGTYARQSPFGCWFEDVRALGFLRPPWALAFDGIVATAWPLEP
jgi:alkylation response protein AidB-like acyl-CoA dehydrogenase